MNTMLNMIGLLGWLVIIFVVLGGGYLLWVVMVESSQRRHFPPPQEPTDPNLPTCSSCGWVEGVNRDCAQCAAARRE